MNIKQTIDFLENLKNTSEKKSEINLYKLFSEVLTSIESMNFPEDKINDIANKLEELNIDGIQEKQYKYIKKQFLIFTQYLEDEYKIVQKGYYTGLGIVFGMSIGMGVTSIIGFIFGMGSQINVGLIGGMLVGMIIGSVLDKKAEEENRILVKK